MSTTDTERINPFPGLRPFTPEEDYLFFGREDQTDELQNRLKKRRFLAVVGSSGSGKSSLVRAGLLPALYGGFMLDDGSDWRVAMFRPGAHPIRSMSEALADPEVFGHEDKELAAYQAIMLETSLRRGELGLVDIYEESRIKAKGNLLIVVDQFEELFRFKKQRNVSDYDNEGAAFVKLLLAASKSEVPVYVVLTMRSDFLGDCSQFHDLPEAINDGQFLVPRMSRDQRQRAIEGPIAVGGAKVEKRLVQRLLNDVGDNPDQLPILQHALMRTWDAWEKAGDAQKNAPLDLDHYLKIGGMEEALSMHGDEIFFGLSNERSQKIAELIFKRLTDRSQDARGVRRPTPFAELVQVSEATPEEVAQVVDAFREPGRSLLMPPYEVKLRDDGKIDISHESLMRVWKRLNSWVNAEADSAKTYLRLANTAELHARGQAGLWRDPDLQLTLDWKKATNPSKAWSNRYHDGFENALDFLESSRLQWEQEQREKEEQQKHELQVAKERAAEQAASAKRLRRLLFLTSFVAAIAIIAFSFAYVQFNRAEIAREDAVSQKTEAELQRNLATQNEQRALVNEERALASARRSDSLFVALENQVLITDNKAELARLASELASKREQEALRSAAEADTQRAMAELSAKQASLATEEARSAQEEATRNLLQSIGVDLAINAIRLHEVGDVELGALLAREAYRFDKQSGEEFRNEIYNALHRSLTALLPSLEDSDVIHTQDRMRAVSESSTGWIASGGDNERIYLSSPNGQNYALETLSGRVKTIAFSNDGSVLGASSSTGGLKLWSLKGDTPKVLELTNTISELSPMALDNYLLSNLDSEDIVSRRSQQSLDTISDRSQQGEITSLVFTKDNVLIAGFENGSVGIFPDTADASSDNILQEIHEGSVFDVAVNPSGTLLASTGRDDYEIQVRQFPIDDQKPILLKGHIAPINEIVFSPDGSELASASSDGTIRIWSITGTGVGTIVLEGHSSWVWSVDFSNDGNSILSGSADRTTRLWQINTSLLEEQICTHISRSLTPQEWQEHIGKDISFVEYHQSCTSR